MTAPLAAALLAVWWTLNLTALEGDAPAEVAASLGQPDTTFFSGPDVVPAVRVDVFSVAEGGHSGGLAVSYCDGAAFKFSLGLEAGPVDADGLVALAGVDTSGMERARSSALSAEWFGEDSEHVVATSSEAGWTGLEVNYGAEGC